MNRTFTDAQQYHSADHVQPAKGFTGSISHAVKRSVVILWMWHDRAGQRRQLARLTSHQLEDIGISSTMAAFEADKPFWKA